MASIVSAGTTSATALNMSADTTGILQLASNNGTVGLTIDTSQNVGINNPNSTIRTKLMVSSSNASDTLTVGTVSGGFSITNTNSTYGLQFGSLSTGNSWIQSARMDGTATAYNLLLQLGGGNVGIGTATPNANSGNSLVLYDASTPRFRLTNSTTGQAAGDGAELSLFNSNFNIETRENANIIYYLNGAERSRMTPVGTTETATFNSGSLYAGDGVVTTNGVNTITFDLATMFPDLIGMGGGMGIVMQIQSWTGSASSGQCIIVVGQKSNTWTFTTIGGASAASQYSSSSGSGTSITVNFAGTIYGQIRVSCMTRN